VPLPGLANLRGLELISHGRPAKVLSVRIADYLRIQLAGIQLDGAQRFSATAAYCVRHLRRSLASRVPFS